MFPIISKRFRRTFFYIGVHLVLWVCMFYTNSVEHILRKVDKMKSLKQIQSDFPEAKYFIPEGANEPDRSLVIDTSEKAQKLSERDSWYYNSLVETVPIELAEAASQLTKNRNEVFDLDNIANWNPFAFEAAVKKVTACKVISIIESQVFVDERAEGLLINDVLVCEPIDGSLEGLKIYVPQIDAGINQPRNLESMINNIYPVYITDLKHRKAKTRKLSRMADKLYVALGSIQQGEFLRNMNLKLEFDELNETIQDAKNIIEKNTSMAEIRKAKRVLENAEKDLKVFTSEKRRGIVTNIGRNGVYLLSQNLETVYIAYSHFSFKSRSASLRPSDYINLKDEVEFTYTHYELRKVRNIKASLSSPYYYVIVGSCLEGEESPLERLNRLVKNNEFAGTYWNARIIDADFTRKHLIELEEFPGILFKMQSDPRLTQKIILKNPKILVRMVRCRPKGKPNDAGIYDEFVSDSVFVDFIETQKDDILAGFFS